MLVREKVVKRKNGEQGRVFQTGVIKSFGLGKNEYYWNVLFDDGIYPVTVAEMTVEQLATGIELAHNCGINVCGGKKNDVVEKQGVASNTSEREDQASEALNEVDLSE
ncbi:hypothetical protein V7S43_016887 [Phytophthora oleae]|uniref:PiggyBac transposable element-derived protein domain-containing protein n=1 Tax=Phytophthora oleae TaxID=2107226 RepID=A0ABD3EWG2_9STRA